MTGDQLLVENILSSFPELMDLYEIHLENNGGVLPHVFFWDLTQEIVASYRGLSSDLNDWRRMLAFLEESYGSADVKAKEVIMTSFLYSLPFPTEPGSEIVGCLGPRLSEAYKRVHS